MTLVFAALAAASTTLQTSCGCGGAWFTVGTKEKLVASCFLSACASWLLSTRPAKLTALESESRPVG